MTNNEDWEIGETVKLKSGGPLMTIDSRVMGKAEVICKWFVGNKIRQACFANNAVQKSKKS